MKSLNIIADSHIWGAKQAFSTLPKHDVKLTLCHSREMCIENLKDADIILVRSGIKLGKPLLESSRVRFVATATVGDDHIDKKWLQERGIAFASAAGSSTGAVVEYMTTLFLQLHHLGKLQFSDCTLGIIGAGRIGSRIANTAKTLGMKVMVNDPPRARLEGKKGFVNLETLLQKSDIISLHTPLLYEGLDATMHLINAETLSMFRGYGIINAARGAVIANSDLIHWLDQSPLNFAALDCWEGEPNISIPLLAHTGMAVATPHIAGHSLDGKAANTQSIYDALCHFLGVVPKWDMHSELPNDITLHLNQAHQSTLPILHAISECLYPINRDHNTLQKLCHLHDSKLRATSFTAQRRNYPVRRAWDCCHIQWQPSSPEIIQRARDLGMPVGS
ncbi:MAG: 4-phosphoerythronate dehydrogenase [Mariprofundaceae bacterium]